MKIVSLMEWVALLVMTLLLQGAFVTKATAQTATSPVPYNHIVVVILENHGYSELLGASNSLPFINGVLRASGADMTQSYSLQHPSQDNYYWIFSGSNQGIYDDKAPLAPFTNAPNLYTELTAAHKSFAGYIDAFPGVRNLYEGQTPGATNLLYVTRHVPWLGFSNVPSSISHDFIGFGTNAAGFSKLPYVSFVIPALQHDMHDYTNNINAKDAGEVYDTNTSLLAMMNADAWLSKNIGPYAHWAVTNNSLLIITTDEDSTADWATPPYMNVNYAPDSHLPTSDSNPLGLTAPTASFSATPTTTNGGAQTGSNQITTIFYGANILPGAYEEGNGITHVNLLRTIEWLSGITSGVGAQSAAVTNIGESPVTDIFAGYTGIDNFAGSIPDTNKWLINTGSTNTNDVLSQANGLHFLVPQIEPSANAYWVWTTNAPTTSDWSASLTVTNLASSTISNAFCSIGLSARNPSNTADLGFGMSLGYDHMGGGRQWKANQDIGSNTSILITTNSTVNTGAVLLTYTWTNETLTAAYSTNATPSKLHWVNFASVTLSDLSMSQTNPAANSFLLAISGDASGMKLGMTPAVAAGNFNLTSGATAVSKPVLLPQTITLSGMKTNYTPAPFKLTATASSKLPVTISVLSGPATLSNNLLTLQGAGTVTLVADQLGNDKYPAASVTNSYVVQKANQTISFEAISDLKYNVTPRSPEAFYFLKATASSGLSVTYTVVSGSARQFASLATNGYPVNGSTNNAIFFDSSSESGLVTIRVDQTGDANYEAAFPFTRNFHVTITTTNVSTSSFGGGVSGAGFGNGFW